MFSSSRQLLVKAPQAKVVIKDTRILIAANMKRATREGLMCSSFTFSTYSSCKIIGYLSNDSCVRALFVGIDELEGPSLTA